MRSVARTAVFFALACSSCGDPTIEVAGDLRSKGTPIVGAIVEVRCSPGRAPNDVADRQQMKSDAHGHFEAHGTGCLEKECAIVIRREGRKDVERKVANYCRGASLRCRGMCNDVFAEIEVP